MNKTKEERRDHLTTILSYYLHSTGYDLNEAISDIENEYASQYQGVDELAPFLYNSIGLLELKGHIENDRKNGINYTGYATVLSWIDEILEESHPQDNRELIEAQDELINYLLAGIDEYFEITNKDHIEELRQKIETLKKKMR